MSVSLDALQWVGIIAGSSVLSSAVTALVARRRDTFEVLTTAYDKLGERVIRLEVRLEDIEKDLGAERAEHEHTKSKLRRAMDFIRTVMVWGATERVEPLPVPPAELMVQV